MAVCLTSKASLFFFQLDVNIFLEFRVRQPLAMTWKNQFCSRSAHALTRTHTHMHAQAHKQTCERLSLAPTHPGALETRLRTL